MKLKKKSYKNTIISYLLILVILIIVAFLFFNEYGIIKYINLVNEINDLDQKVEQAETDINSYEKEIDSLKNSDVKIEKVAREKYRMHRDNEKTFTIEEK